MTEGDFVHWTRCEKRKSGFEFLTWHGKVLSIHGSHALVRRKGRTYFVPLEKLRGENQRSELTEMVMMETV